MRTRTGLLLGAALVVVLMFMGSTAHVQSSRIIWEYKIDETWSEPAANKLGGEGWELVAVDSSRGDHVRVFYKRQKQ